MTKRLVLLAIVLVPLAVAAWTYVAQPRRAEARRQWVLAELPPLPDLARHNQGSADAFGAADRRARENPLSADAVGSLGMLYHAYQFADQARRCYAVARELAPGELRWTYYQAVLEKAAYRFAAGEALFRQAIELEPDAAELWAELGDLYLQTGRTNAAEASLKHALDLDPRQPLAALGRARLALLAEDWERVIALLVPLLETQPRLSLCHKYLAVAYANLGRDRDRDRHQAQAEYGSALESPLMRDVHELAVTAIVAGGNPSLGEELVKVKCALCHTGGRIEATSQDRRWWAGTVRRMQRLAGWAWLTDEEAASLVAYLAERHALEPPAR